MPFRRCNRVPEQAKTHLYNSAGDIAPVMTTPAICPLCANAATVSYWQDKRRDYCCCPVCGTVFVPPAFHLTAEREKAEYDLHRNDVSDPGYRRFLARMAAPLLARLPVPAQGLDFGCGPGPALAAMLREAGHSCALYDLYYFPDEQVLRTRYDFITATEVVEHLANPRAVLARLWACLKPGATLALMTKRVQDAEAFRHWHYKNDPTHITFFSVGSFAWLAQHWGATLELIDSDVVFFTKPAAG